MNEIERQIQHEAIKDLMKRAIDNNPHLNQFQKEQQKARVDACAAQADRIEKLLLMIKYLEL